MRCLRLPCWFLSGLMLIISAPQASSAQPNTLRQAENANSFVESIGVNTHINYSDTIYSSFEGLLKPSLLYLGVRHIRDGLTDDGDDDLKRLRDLRSVGIKLTAVVPYETESMPALINLTKTQRDILEAVEGPNETDIFTQFSYRGQKFPEGTIAFMKDFYSAMKADPQLRDLPVLQTTLAFPDADYAGRTRADILGDLSAYADFGNSHNYFSFGEIPSVRVEEDHLPLNSAITPGKAMMSSEGGYAMGDSDGNKGTWGDGLSAPFSEDVHGRYLLRYVLEQYRLGYVRSFIYELFDIDQSQWGLFRADGSPRPAASGIRSMIELLSEGRWDRDAKRWVVPSFELGKLDYSLSDVPASVHSLLFQKNNNTFYLILWNEVNNWDPVIGKPIYTEPVATTLKANQAVKKLSTFLPLTQGSAATKVFDSNAATILVPDHPIIIEVTLQ
jgi:hypothetical protein